MDSVYLNIYVMHVGRFVLQNVKAVNKTKTRKIQLRKQSIKWKNIYKRLLIQRIYNHCFSYKMICNNFNQIIVVSNILIDLSHIFNLTVNIPIF